MATGDPTDMLARLRGGLPPWFPDDADAPIVGGALAGIAAVLAYIYGFIQFAKLQTRIATATGGWLDLIAWDFFGPGFLRRVQELDSPFSVRIIKEILRPRVTRAAIVLMLTDLTGRAPIIIEPWNTGDCGAYDVGTLAYDDAGCWGDVSMTCQILVTAYRPPGNCVPNVSGYDGYGGGYDTSAAFEYIDMSQVAGPVTDAEIYQRIAQTVAAGVTAWTAIENPLPPPLPPTNGVASGTGAAAAVGASAVHSIGAAVGAGIATGIDVGISGELDFSDANQSGLLALIEDI